jgi:hypothetical protein
MESDEDGDDGGSPNSSYRHRKYPSDHCGPFEVFIRQIDKPLNHISISKTINEKYKGVILTLVKVNASKIKIVLSDRLIANQLHEDVFLDDYHVYIPAISVEINGVVTISIDSNEQEFVTNGKGKFHLNANSEINILEAYRFHRKDIDSDGNNVEISSSAVRLTFEGNRLPDFVSIFGLAIPIKPHVAKIMHCTNCLNFGHTIKFCSSKPKCCKCGGKHKGDSCKEIPHICIHCKENIDHSVKEQCPVYASHKNKLVRISKTRVSPPTKQHQNFYSILSTQTDPEPSINSQNSGPPRKRRLQETNKNFEPQPSTSRIPKSQVTKNISFANVVSGKREGGQHNRNIHSHSSQERKKNSRSDDGEREDTLPENSENLEKKTSLRDAIHARIVALKLNTIVQNIIVCLISPILDLFWPMISPFVPFILPLLTQNGAC